MLFILKMPKLSPTMENGKIASWLKQTGEFVKVGEALIDVVTDKASVEHCALESGWLRAKIKNANELISIGEAIAVFTSTEDEPFDLDAIILEHSKKPSPISKQKQEESCEDQNSEIEKKSESNKSIQLAKFGPEQPLENHTWNKSTASSLDKVKISPLAKKIASDNNLNTNSITGTGPNNRIIAKDLEKASKNGFVSFTPCNSCDFVAGQYEEESLSLMQNAVADKLQASKQVIPHFYLKQKVDAEQLLQLKDQLKLYDFSISVNDMIVKACSFALKQHPNINAGFNDYTKKIIKFKTVDISIAVGIPDGLITPIIRFADKKSLEEISIETKSLVAAARASKLKLHEFKGGSFSISNLGMFGISEFSAIINPPQAAILAVGAIEDIAVIKNNSVIPGKVMTLTLSVDHRVANGTDAAAFLQTLKKILENPSVLLLH